MVSFLWWQLILHLSVFKCTLATLRPTAKGKCAVSLLIALKKIVLPNITATDHETKDAHVLIEKPYIPLKCHSRWEGPKSHSVKNTTSHGMNATKLGICYILYRQCKMPSRHPWYPRLIIPHRLQDRIMAYTVNILLPCMEWHETVHGSRLKTFVPSPWYEALDEQVS